MTEITERVARRIWEKRRELAKTLHGIDLEEWGDGSTPRANHIFEEARVAIESALETESGVHL